jgi:hypothetical protein
MIEPLVWIVLVVLAVMIAAYLVAEVLEALFHPYRDDDEQ